MAVGGLFVFNNAYSAGAAKLWETMGWPTTNEKQFEEMLRNLDVTSKSQRRNDTNKDKQHGEGIGPVRRPPPPEYRELWEAYTKSMSKKQAAESPKK